MRWLSILLAGLALLGGGLYAGLTPPRLSPPERADLIIAGVTVVNPGLERRETQTLVIREGRIRELRPTRPGDPAPICPGCFALPGLIDAHVHTPPRLVVGNPQLFSLLHLAHGVTTVRDVGESEPAVAELAAQLNRGERVGPRMFRCGPVLDGDPPAWPVAEVITNAAQAVRAVERLADAGVDCIKVYNEIGPEAYDAIARTAARRGLPLVGHVPHAVGLAGVSNFEAQHMTGVPYLSHPRPPTGWDLRPEDVLALTDPEIEAALDLSVSRRIAFTPTLANFSLRLIASDPSRFPPTPGSQLLPAIWRERWDLVAGHPDSEAKIAAQQAAIPRLRDMVGGAHRRSIDVLAGTDTLMPWVVPGESLHLELAELERALGSAERALAAATTVNGRRIAPGEIGTLAEGARADLLLLPADPTRNLEALRDWRILIADGRRYDRGTLDAWVTRYQRHFNGALYGAVTRTLSFLASRYGSAFGR